MTKRYKARGVVLHTIRYGDTQLIVHVLTDVLGRQAYLTGTGRTRKGHGNRGALFQPMFPIAFEGLSTGRSELHRFHDVHAAPALGRLPFDVRKSTIALFMAETLYRLVREVEPDPDLFAFVQQSVEALDALEHGIANFHLWFLVALSRHLGFYPGNGYTAGDWFDIPEGHFTPSAPAHAIALDPEQAATLGALLELRPEALDTLALGRGQRVAFLRALLRYFTYHLDAIREVRSLDILQEVF